MKKNVAHGFKWNILDALVSNLTNLIGMVVIARLIEPKDIGIMAMLFIFIAFSDVLVNSGFSQALVQKNKNVSKEDCNTVFTINFIISIVLYIIFFLASKDISSFYNTPELSSVIKIYFLSLIINSLTLVPKALLSIEYNFLPQSIINISSTIVGMLSSIIAAYYGFGYWSLVINPMVKSIISSILFLMVTNWRPAFKININSFKELFSYGGKLMIASFLNVLTINIHNVLIGRYFNANTLGYYTQSNNFSNVLSKNISIIVQKMSFPLISSIKEEREKVILSFESFLFLVSFVSLPLLVGFASIAKEFVYIFLGEKWSPMINCLLVLSLSRAISPVGIFSISVISALGRSDLVLKTDFIKLPISLLVLFFTVPNGILAVAYGQLLLSVLYFIINSYYTGKLLSFGLFEQIKAIYKLYIAASFMFIVNYNFQFEGVFFSLIAKVIIGFLVFIIVGYILNVRFIRNPRTLKNLLKLNI